MKTGYVVPSTDSSAFHQAVGSAEYDMSPSTTRADAPSFLTMFSTFVKFVSVCVSPMKPILRFGSVETSPDVAPPAAVAPPVVDPPAPGAPPLVEPPAPEAPPLVEPPAPVAPPAPVTPAAPPALVIPPAAV